MSITAPFGTLAGRLFPPAASAKSASAPIVVWPSLFSTGAVQIRLTELLRAEGPVLVVDPPGHGASRPLEATALTLAQTADATLSLLEEAGLRGPIRLVGTSWGGLVGLAIAQQNPEKLAHLALLNTPFEREPSAWNMTRLLPTMARWMGRSRTFSNGVARSFFLPQTVSDPTNAEVMAAHHATFQDGDPRAMAAAAIHVFRTREDVKAWLGNVACDALVIAGRHDPMYDPAMQRNAATALPNGRFAVVEAAHIAAVDAPEDVFHILREDWAARTPKPQAQPNGAIA
ncbi:MAG: alpha/beta hydrolase [Pseudomonadota bacterium]